MIIDVTEIGLFADGDAQIPVQKSRVHQRMHEIVIDQCKLGRLALTIVFLGIGFQNQSVLSFKSDRNVRGGNRLCRLRVLAKQIHYQRFRIMIDDDLRVIFLFTQFDDPTAMRTFFRVPMIVLG